MSTAFATVQLALVAALSAAPALADGRIHANSLRPIPAGHNAAIVLRLEQSAGDEQVLGALDWRTSFVVECYARAPAGADPSLAVDALLAAVWQRLAALDEAATGACITLQPAIEWQYDATETPVACASIRLTAQHRSTTADLTLWS